VVEVYSVLPVEYHVELIGLFRNIITNEEKEKIIYGLNEVLEQITNGEFVFDVDLEDVHMNIENGLQKLIGKTAGKLHTARSRNNQHILHIQGGAS
jgi:argininosuccinate lyase